MFGDEDNEKILKGSEGSSPLVQTPKETSLWSDDDEDSLFGDIKKPKGKSEGESKPKASSLFGDDDDDLFGEINGNKTGAGGSLFD